MVPKQGLSTLGEFGVSRPLVNAQFFKKNPSYHIHALDVLTLEERPGFPALVSGPADNASHLLRDTSKDETDLVGDEGP